MPLDLSNAHILVTGGNGFLGRHLSSLLKGLYPKCKVSTPAKDHVNLLAPADAYNFIEGWNRPVEYVFHLAGYNGSIAFNYRYPADIFLQNTVMGLNLLNNCAECKVKKVVSVVASCAYPAQQWEMYDEGAFSYPREVCEETDFLDGEPHDSVACHGYAKRNLQLATKFFHEQYGLNAVCACPTTLYGPGDSIDPERTKVMGALIAKFSDAVRDGKQEVVCWGTGAAQREFLYVEDAVHQLIQTMLHYEDHDIPLNLGTGQEFSIKEVADIVGRAVLFGGEIRWDRTKPDGQLRKRLDLSRMTQILPPFAFTSLEDGVKKTADWYRGIKS